jgi:hypothetical protein
MNTLVIVPGVVGLLVLVRTMRVVRGRRPPQAGMMARSADGRPAREGLEREVAAWPGSDSIRSALEAATDQARRRRSAVRWSLLAFLTCAPVVAFLLSSAR